MREKLANWLMYTANCLSKEYKWRKVPKNQYNTRQRLHMLIDELNGTLHQVPPGLHFWIDWTERRNVLCLRRRDPGKLPEIVYPPLIANKYARVREELAQEKAHANNL